MKKFLKNLLIFLSAIFGLFLPLVFIGENEDLTSKLIYLFLYLLSGFLFICFGRIFATDRNKTIYLLTKIGVYFFGFILLFGVLVSLIFFDQFSKIAWEMAFTFASLSGVIAANQLLLFKKK
jgi:hypothetical protein